MTLYSFRPLFLICLILGAVFTSCKKNRPPDEPVLSNPRDTLYTKNTVFDASRIDISISWFGSDGSIYISPRNDKDSINISLRRNNTNGKVRLVASEPIIVKEPFELYTFNEGFRFEDKKLVATFFKSEFTPVVKIVDIPQGGSFTVKNIVFSFDDFESIIHTREQALEIINKGLSKITEDRYDINIKERNGNFITPK